MPALGIFGDEIPHRLFADPAGFGNSCHLELRGRRSDVRIKARSRSGDQIDGYKFPRIFRLSAGDICIHTIDELLIGRTQV